MKLWEMIKGLTRPDPALMDGVRLAIGHLEARYAKDPGCASVRDAEFSCFSQWGEDGILQYLIARIPILNRRFVEFGVGDYRESNTRFLLEHDNWQGLAIDGGDAHRQFLVRSGLAWRYDIKSLTAFVTQANINDLLRSQGFVGDIGILSIDIDGNDYWILQAISVVSPRILVVEYNSTFGADLAVTVPYDERFQRTRAHFSNLYAGASLQAICRAAREKGYEFVGSNGAGNNAFFVRRDVLGAVQPVDPVDGFVSSRFRESRGPEGELTYISDHLERLRVIKDLPLCDLSTGRIRSVGDLFLPSRASGCAP